MPRTCNRFLLALALWPFAAFPLSADTPISTVRFFTDGDDVAPAIASNGVNGMAAWAHGATLEVCARPLGAYGSPLLRSRIPIPFVGSMPALASDGNGYLVVIGGRGQTLGVRLDSDGNVLDPNAFVVHRPTLPQNLPLNYGFTFRAVAWDGARYVVASTRESETGGSIETAVIASTVAVSGPAFVVRPEILVQDHAAAAVVAARNGVSLFAWPASSGIGARTLQGVDIIGQVTAIATVATPAGLSATATDDGFAVVWNDGSVRAQQFDPGGEVSGSPITIAAGPVIGRVAVTAATGGFEAAWSNGADILISRVSHGIANEPQRIGPSRSPAEGECAPAIVSIGGTTVVEWIDAASNAVTKAADSTADPSPLDVAVPAQVMGDMTFDGSNYFAAWEEAPFWNGEFTSYTVMAGRITPSEEDLDGSGIVIADHADLVGTFHGMNANLILWTAPNPYGIPVSLNGTLVRNDGRVVGASVLATANPPDTYLSAMAAVWNGSSFLVTWFTDALYGVRIAPDGQVLDPLPMRILDYPVERGVMADGEYAYVGRVNDSVLLFVLDEQLRWTSVAILDRPDVEIPGQPELASVDIATDGDDYFVVWWRKSDRIAGQAVRHGGTVAGPPITIATGTVLSPSVHVAWNGRTYDIAWNNADTDRLRADLLVTRITAGGTSEGTMKIATIKESPATDPFVGIVPGALIYNRLDSTDQYVNVVRLFFRPLPPARQRVGGDEGGSASRRD